MFVTRIQRLDDTYFIEIPAEEMDRLHLAEGDEIAFTPTKIEKRDGLEPELQGAVERIVKEHREALDYLAER